MDTTQIITEIESQIERLHKARALLLGSTEASLNPNATIEDIFQQDQRAPGRPAAVVSRQTQGQRKPKGITPEGRKRIAEAMRKRWAAQKAATKRAA